MKQTPEQIIEGNLKIKKWLQDWAPSVHSDYVKFDQPFEFHKLEYNQFLVVYRFAPYFKNLSLYKKFFDCKDDSERFQVLLDLVDVWNCMKEVQWDRLQKKLKTNQYYENSN